LLAKRAFLAFERPAAVAQVKNALKLQPDNQKFQVRLARICRDFFQLDEAASIADKILKKNPEDIATRLLRIGSNLPRGRTAEVLAALNSLVGKEVPAAPFLVLRGEALLLLGRHSAALSDLSQVPASSPEKARARALAVLAWLGSGKTENAKKAVKSLTTRHPKLALTHYALGSYRLSRNLTRSAKSSLNRAVALDPWCYQALDALAGLAFDTGKTQEAGELAERALAANPYDGYARQMLGELKLKENDAKGALEHFARVAQEIPASREALTGMAEALYRLDRTEQALKAITKARKAGAQDARARAIEGRILLAQGEFRKAASSLRAADREKPKDAEILADLGLALLGARSYTRAEEAFKDGLRRRKLPRAQEGLARVLLKKRKYKDAAKAFEKAARYASRNKWKTEDIAKMYMDGGQAWVKDRSSSNNFSRARRLFRKAARLLPKDPEPHYQIGAAFDRDDKLPAARKEYMTALEMNPKHPQALYRLGLLEFDTENDAKAKEYLEAFLKVQPEGKDARRAQQILKRIK
jgi:tetratricopeptide (TPR) repeat protein